MDQKLLKSVIDKDLDSFQRLVKNATNQQLNHVYGFPTNGTLLELSIDRNLEEFVEALLAAGADADLFSQPRERRPLHYAAENGHFECIRHLLAFGADINAKSGMSGRTALHELITGWSDDSSYQKSFRELVNHPKMVINIEDDDEATPLELAVEKRLENVTKRLLDLGATVTDTARALIQDTFPDMLRPEVGLQQFNNNSQLSETELSSDLMKSVRNNEIEQCRRIFELAAGMNLRLNLNKAPSDGPTYLQLACQIGLSEIVELLLSNGASSEATSKSTDQKPIILACGSGSEKILQALLSNGANINEVCTTTRQTVLHEVAQQLAKNPRQYIPCLGTVLAYRNGEFNVNAQDNSGNTALHYAVLSGCEDAVLLLLRNGADISVTNVCGNTPLERIHPEILEAFLDECIMGNKSSPAASNFILNFDYSFLSSTTPLPTLDLDRTDASEAAVFPECQRISKKSEIEVLREIASTSRLQPLLRHPVIRSFVAFKWFKISWAFWVNCSLFFGMILLLTGYVVLLKEHGKSDNNATATEEITHLEFTKLNQSEDDYNAAWTVLLGTALSTFAALLLIRELFQMSIDFDRYIRSFENYVEILLIISTIAMLISGERVDIAVNFAAIAIILAWLELLLLVGRYPGLSTYVAAFVTVLKTFTIMLIGYSLLIIGFALSFYVLGVFDEKGETPASATQGISRSIMRCYVMMTGELDYSGLEFDEKPLVTKGVFLFFVFLVTIILINLLNALAVSDTQMIKNKSEIVIYASHIEMISYFESMFLRRPFHCLRQNYPGFRSCFDVCFRPIRRILNPERVLVFNQCLPTRRYQVYSNRNPKSRLSDDVLHCACHVGYRIEPEVLTESLEIMRKISDRENEKAENVEKRVENLEIIVRDLVSRGEK